MLSIDTGSGASDIRESISQTRGLFLHCVYHNE